MKRNQKQGRKFAYPISRRAIAAILAGIMIVGSVPAPALADALGEAQSTAVVQQDSGGGDTTEAATADDSATTAQGGDAQETSFDDDTVAGKIAKTIGSENGIAVIKALISLIGNASSGEIGGVAKAINDLISAGQTDTSYTTEDIMNQLFKMDAKLDTISTQVYNLNDAFKSSNDLNVLNDDNRTISGYRGALLGGDFVSIPQRLASLNNTLSNYKEKGTDTPCSLATPFESLPDEAINDIKNAVNDIEQKAKDTIACDSVALMENRLYSLIKPESSGKNYVDHYFACVNDAYNFEPETYTTKAEFLTTLGAMYANAYAATSAMYNLKMIVAQSEGNTARVDMIKAELDAMPARAEKVGQILFGTDGNESAYVAQTHEKEGATMIKCLVPDANGKYATFSKGGYGKDSALNLNGIGLYSMYTKCDWDSSDGLQSGCGIQSSFTADQVVTMVGRLDALPEASRPRGSDGEPVGDLDSELEALGYKNVASGSVSASGGQVASPLIKKLDQINSTPRYTSSNNRNYVELGDPNVSSQLERIGRANMGERLVGSENYVVTGDLKRVTLDESWINKYRGYLLKATVVCIKGEHKGEVIRDQVICGTWYERADACDEHGNPYVNYDGRFLTVDLYDFGTYRLGTPISE